MDWIAAALQCGLEAGNGYIEVGIQIWAMFSVADGELKKSMSVSAEVKEAEPCSQGFTEKYINHHDKLFTRGTGRQPLPLHW
jgi:hypothetical protein